MWLRLGGLCMLLLVLGSSVLFVAVSIDCNVVLDRSLTACRDAHLGAVLSTRLVPHLQYGLHIVCCGVFLWLGRSMLLPPWTHVKRIYSSPGLHMTEAVLWFCTTAAIIDRAWSVGHDGVYDVLVSAVVSLVLNSLCTSYGAHMDLASFTRLDDGNEDDEERDPFAHAVNAARASVAEHGGAMLTLVRCLFVHNVAMFLANTSYVVAMITVDDDSGGGEGEPGPVSRRVLVLLGLYVVWYRGSQSTFWFNKHNFPHANVMLPRYDEAARSHWGRGRDHYITAN